jgi:hypothetical protein
MEPSFLSGLRHIDSPLLTRVAKDVYPSLLGSLKYTVVCTPHATGRLYNIEHSRLC